MSLVDLIARIRLTGAREATQDLKGVRGGFHDAAGAARDMGESVRAAGGALRSVALVGLGAGVGIGAAAMKVAADMDTLTRSLASVSANSDDLHAQLGRLKEVAKLPGLGFQEAIQGSVRLQNAGLSARQAEAAMMAFGNAIALVGGGKAELDGVTLALTQMASKGKVSAEEINQLNERVPQIRRAMQDAFGTADTEALGKMGVDAATFIEKITVAMNKLPVATGGVKNAAENLGQSIKDALEPLGTGLVRALSEAGPLIDRVLGRVREISNFLGEGLMALVRSGVLSEFFGEIEARVKGAFGDGPRRAFAEFAGGVLAFFSELPSMIADIGRYLQAVFGTMGRNIETIFRRMGWIKAPKAEAPAPSISFDAGPPNAIRHHNPNVEEVGYDQSNPFAVIGRWVRDMAVEGTTALGKWILSHPSVSPNGKFSGFLFGGMADGVFDNLEPLPSFGGDSFANFDSKRKRWADNILGSWGPIGDPEGLIFGGGQDTKGKGVASNPISALLAQIEQHTRKQADMMSLRYQTIGGGDIAHAGVTASEMAASGHSPYAPADWQYARRPANTQLEAAYRQMVREEIARTMGRPRR